MFWPRPVACGILTRDGTCLSCPLQWKLRVLTSRPPSLLIHYPGWGLRLCPLLPRSHSLCQLPHQAAWSWVGDSVERSSWPEQLFPGTLPASLLGDSLVLPGSTWLRGQRPIVLHREGPWRGPLAPKHKNTEALRGTEPFKSGWPGFRSLHFLLLAEWPRASYTDALSLHFLMCRRGRQSLPVGVWYLVVSLM